MSYTPTTWTTGDTITATKLNKIEQGIASAGGGILFDIGVEDGTLDKTWTEIDSAMSAGKIVRIVDSGEGFSATYYVVATSNDGEFYYVNYTTVNNEWYQTSSASGYPEYVED